MKQEQESNVYCPKCKCWMWIGLTKKKEEGYICNECYEEEQEDKKILEEFQEVGEANFGSRGLR